MKKAILLDIDGVPYPMKENHSDFLHEDENKELLGEGLVIAFKQSTFTYLRDFFRYTMKTNPNQYEAYETHIKKTLGRKIKPVQSTFEENVTLHFLRKFGDTDYFVKGYNMMIHAMTKVLETQGMLIIGATSRGHEKNPDWIYNNCFERTNEWNEKNYNLFDKIYFKEHGNKITVLNDIRKDFGINTNEILCMVEDSAYELEDFMKRGITGVFINEDKIYNAPDKIRLQKKYRERFKVANNYSDAKAKVLNLYAKAT